MGEHEGWAQPSGLLPNGLLPNAGPVIPFLDSERWLKAEERTAELIVCIQPNQPSEDCRNAVANYVKRLIMKCFPCQVFTFGSVPLKTYLPDGDIDLTAFSNNQNLKDAWANQVCDMLENEEKNEHAEFHVKEVQYIQAEVKIIKCLVENIVVDISFNQLGGLCTLCFLEEVDHLINQNHLFKRSIILIKAWCYYESRILGAHHGLISTYALETLVLYIFHVFNNSFTGPLEVLYRFLEFFSNFDWDSFCISLRGPVPISSLPDVTAKAPRKDSGKLLFSKWFLDACSSVYAPGGQENQGQPFVSKHFNVIDPLRINNNLGRSVSKGNFFRIRSAFAFGAKRLARLLDCPKEFLILEVNQFFMNTWGRHGSGHRPDAPRTDLWRLTLSPSDHLNGSENVEKNLSAKQLSDNSSGNDAEVEGTPSCSVSSQHGNYPLESMSRTSDVSAAFRSQSHRNDGNSNISSISEQIVQEVSSNQVAHTDRSQRNVRSDRLMNDIQGKFFFARTHSSPELTDTYSDVSSRGRRNRAPESGRNQANYERLDSNRRKNGSEILANRSGLSSTDVPSYVRHVPSHQSLGAVPESNSSSNIYHLDSGLGAMGEEISSVYGTRGMHQEEQDLVNMMASSSVHGFNGQVHVPLNLASAHLPLSISPSIFASMGYDQRNMAGIVPTNMPFIDPSFSNIQFPHGLVSPPLTPYFPGSGLTSNLEDSIEPGNENFGSMEMNSREADHDFWQERDVGSFGGFDSENGNFEILQSDDKPQSAREGFSIAPSSQVSGSGNAFRVHQKFTKEIQGAMQEDHLDNFQYQENRGNKVYSDERILSSRFSSAAHSSKTSSESSWEGSSAKVSKSMREKQGKKTVPAEPSTMYGKGKGVFEHVSPQAEDNNSNWNSLSNMSTEMIERSSGPESVASPRVPGHHIPGYELAQTSRSDSVITNAPVLSSSRQRKVDNSGVLPFTFYPTGPPVPFLTMLPVYNIPLENGTSEASTSHFEGEEDLDNCDSVQNFNISEGLDQSEDLNTFNFFRRAASVETSNAYKPDILNSDFASHWQNLQYGRFCQNTRSHGPLVYPSPVMVPPVYLQGHFTQLMNYSPRLVPVAPLQSVSTRPLNVYQRYVEDPPRYRSGTGTYLPNPKISARDRHSSGTRRGNYNSDRNDNYGDREGNWKPRSAGRSHNRGQADKSSLRLDRLTASESRADRSWSSYRHDTFPSYESQNGPLPSNPNHSGPPSVAYGMYPLPSMNPDGMSSNGPTVPSVVMVYPFDHNSSYGSHAEQLEFGSLGPVGLSSVNEQPQLIEGSRVRGGFEEHSYHGGSLQRSSPDQPSSPHLQRFDDLTDGFERSRVLHFWKGEQLQIISHGGSDYFARSVAKRNYQLKDEDFQPLAFPNQVENYGGGNYVEKPSLYRHSLFSPQL